MRVGVLPGTVEKSRASDGQNKKAATWAACRLDSTTCVVLWIDLFFRRAEVKSG
jgi:hypothetical protein